MARVIRRRWTSDFTGPSRIDNRPCHYEAYLPDALVGREFAFDGRVASDVAEAETAIVRLDAEAAGLLDTESLARILLRAESVASSRIEGLEVGARRLLRADAARRHGQGSEERTTDVTAAEVLANIDAMAFAVDAVGAGADLTVETILETHRRLLAGTRLAEHAGTIRDVQNWIGGSDYNPCAADFVPPPAEHVGDLLADLVSFCNDDSLPVVAQAAVAHAQFETIHPFVDGNGRTGRALIHMVFRRRDLATRTLVPVSLVLATHSRSYLEGLAATRYSGGATSASATAGTNLWVSRFAGACLRAVQDAASFERRMHELEQTWRARLGRVRARSAVDLLLGRLAGTPVLTVAGAAALIGRSVPQTAAAVTRLAEAEVLRQVTVGRRNRAFEAPDVIEAFTDLERQLASPSGDTRITAPARRVPRR